MKITIPELSLVVLVGPSGSGKSSFGRKLFLPTEVVSSDACRGLVSDNENDQSATNDAFDLLHTIVRKRLGRGRLTVIDATNVQPEARKSLVELAREYHVLPVAIVFDLPEKLCQERNASRPDRQFGPHVIRNQAQQMRRSLRGLEREGFRYVFKLASPEEVDAVTIERQPLWNNRRDVHGPFDIVGDIHGCFDPAITAAFDQSPQPFSFGGAGARDVGIAWLIPFPSKIWQQNKIGNADIGAFDSNYRLQTQVIASLTSQQYDSLLVARKHRAVLLEGRGLSADFLKRTQARYEAGTAAKLDVIKAQVDLAQSDNDLIANELDIANAQAALNRFLGRVIGTPIAPTDTLGLPDPLPDSTTIEQTALQNRPELTQLASQQYGAHANTNLLRQFWIPDFTFGVTRDYTQPAAPVYSTGIALPLPVFFWQHSRGEIAESKHHEQELEASYRDLRAQVTQDVRSAYATASTSMRQVLFLRDQLVPSAREAFRVASVSYSLGGSSALEVLDARRTLLDAERQLADALASANIARADLERALGVPLTTLVPGTR